MPGQRHRPTAQTRGIVEAMVVSGVPQADIAKAIPKTLRKCYREALDHATILLTARVARHLGKIATTGRGAAAVSACRYILGCKAGWKDVARLEVESPVGDKWGSDAATARERILERVAAMADTREKLQ
jgi:hypothetical protein